MPQTCATSSLCEITKIVWSRGKDNATAEKVDEGSLATAPLPHCSSLPLVLADEPWSPSRYRLPNSINRCLPLLAVDVSVPYHAITMLNWVRNYMPCCDERRQVKESLMSNTNNSHARLSTNMDAFPAPKDSRLFYPVKKPTCSHSK